MQNPGKLGLALLAVAVLALVRIAHGGQPATDGREATIRWRSSVEFAEACFYKPVEADSEEVTFKLAPLLLREVEAGADNSSCSNTFGTLVDRGGGVFEVDLNKPAVYVHPDTVEIRGKLHGRVTYLWFGKPEARAGADTGSAAQGVRITLNSSGEPAIWEVLTDASGWELIFVSQNVESAAAAEFGAPLPRRQYAVEVSVAQAAKAVVARVLDDGPVPMGPIVYLSKQGGDVETLICRCMPSQAKKLVATETYELRTWAGDAVPRPPGTAFWPNQPDNRLEKCLRLPEKF